MAHEMLLTEDKAIPRIASSKSSDQKLTKIIGQSSFLPPYDGNTVLFPLGKVLKFQQSGYKIYSHLSHCIPCPIIHNLCFHLKKKKVVKLLQEILSLNMYVE